ncbi:hypothetical protein JYQ94_19055 [Klebsiella michiganensis]|nr:hypothetical protein [Klebsiella michiganensis]
MFAGKKSAQIREILISESAWEEMTCLFAPSLEWRAPLGLRGCGFFQIVNNKIIFQRGYWDKLSFLKQHNLPIE